MADIIIVGAGPAGLTSAIYLRRANKKVLVLEADENYPDSVFTEDPAVVMDGCAVITNPAKDSRNGEKNTILPAIRQFYRDDQIFHIEAPGTL